MGIIKAICVSDVRGIQKTNVGTARLTVDYGITGDAHGGNWHRQVSLLSYNKIEDFNKKGADVGFGAFGENIIVDGIDFRVLPVGTKLSCNDALLEITQIGKECHTHCQIYHKMGDCIMPREGVFAKVIKDGDISVGDIMEIAGQPMNSTFRAGVLTVSDKGSKGERVDESGVLAAKLLAESGYGVVDIVIVPDEKKKIEEALINFSDRRQVDLVITTGGTGFSARDITPEATLSIAKKRAPGISEAIRAYSLTVTKRAMLSRGESVIRDKTVIINLPGSVKAVRESLEFILPELKHGIEILRGDASECGGK